MRRDFLNRLIKKYFKQFIDSFRVLRPHCRTFRADDFKHYCAVACAGTCQAHMRCTAVIDESVHQIWRNRFVYSWVLTRSCSVSLKESSIVFVCFGRIISQNLFRNFIFEIINYFQCRSNGSSWPHLNQMLEFSLNRPTTRKHVVELWLVWKLNLCTYISKCMKTCEGADVAAVEGMYYSA